MTTWVIQRVEALSVRNVQDLADGNKALFIDLFFNKDDFTATLHEGGILRVAQENDDKDNDNHNNNDDANTDEDPN